MKMLSRLVAGVFALIVCALYAGPLAAAAPPIKIGFGMSLSGPLAGGGKSALLAYKVWQKEINAHGGLLGRKVEFVYYDDQTNPALVPSIYSKLLDVDKVDIVISGYGTGPVEAALPVVIAHKRTFLALFALDANGKFKYKRYFTMEPSGPHPGLGQSKAFFKLASGLSPKPKTIAIVGADNEYAQHAIVAARKLAKKDGFKVVYDEAYPPNTVDFTSIVRNIKVLHPDLVFISSYPPDSAGMLRAIYEVGLTAKMLGGAMVGLQFAALEKEFGCQLNGIVDFDNYAPERTMQFPGVAAFLKKYRAQAAAAGVDPLGLYLPPYAYAEMQILAQTVKAVHGFNDAKMAAYLHKTTFKTVVGDVHWGPYGEWDPGRQLTVQYRGIKDHDVWQFAKPGTRVILDPPQLKSGSLKVPFALTKGCTSH